MVLNRQETERSLRKLRELASSGQLRRPDGQRVPSSSFPPLTPAEAAIATPLDKPVIRTGQADDGTFSADVINVFGGIIATGQTQQEAESGATKIFNRDYKGRRPPPGFRP